MQIARHHDQGGHADEFAESLVGGQIAEDDKEGGVPLKVCPGPVHEAGEGNVGQAHQAARPQPELADQLVVAGAVYDLDAETDREEAEGDDECLARRKRIVRPRSGFRAFSSLPA